MIEVLTVEQSTVKPSMVKVKCEFHDYQEMKVMPPGGNNVKTYYATENSVYTFYFPARMNIEVGDTLEMKTVVIWNKDKLNYYV